MKKLILIPILLFAINCIAQTSVETGAVLQTTNQVYIKNQTDSLGARIYWYFGAGKYAFRIPKWQDLNQFRYNFHNGLTKTGIDVTAGGSFNSDISFTSTNNSQFATVVQDGLGNNGDIGVTGNFSAIYTSDNNSNTYGIQSSPTNSVVGRIGLNKFQALRFKNNQIVFVDSMFSKGPVAAGNYEGNYTSKSYTSKRYVDSASAVNIVTAGGGITKTGNSINLGGILTDPVTILQGATSGFLVLIADNLTAPLTLSTLQVSPASSLLNSQDYNANRQFLAGAQAGNGKSNLTYIVDTFSSPVTTEFSVGTTGMLFTDNVFSKGATYNANYFANGNTDDRWIPDWGAVKNLVSSSTITVSEGLTKTSNNVTLGGTFTTAIPIQSTNGSQFAVTSLDASGFQSAIGINSTLSAIQTSDNAGNTFGITSGTSNTSFGRIVGTTNPQTLNFNPNHSISLSDALAQKGLVYSANYFSNGSLDDRWIPDWGAVKSIVPTITAFNGLTKTGNDITLEGALIKPTVVNSAGQVFVLGDLAASTPYYLGTDPALGAGLFSNGATYSSNILSSIDGGAGISTTKNSNSTITSLKTNSGIIQIQDQINNKGAVYVSDYSTIGVTDNRWIPDYGAVKSLDANNVKLTGNQTITGGKTFTANTVWSGGDVLLSNNSFYMDSPSGNGMSLQNGTPFTLGNTGNTSTYSFRNLSTSHYDPTAGLNISEYPYLNGAINIIGNNIKDDTGKLFLKDGDAVPIVNPSIVGNLYNQTTWNNFNDFTAQGNYTLVNGNIHVTALQADVLTTNYVTSLSNFTLSYTYKATNAVSNAAGIRFGIKTINIVSAAGFQFWFDESTRKINVFNVSTSITTTGTSILPAYTPGDLLTISVTYTNPTEIFTLTNQTTGQSITMSATSLISINRGNLAILPQTTSVAYDISNITLSTGYKTGGNLFIGDSIDNGSLATPGNGYTFQLNGQIQAGNGDYTVGVIAGLSEIIKLKPETAYIKIGTNDAFLAIWQANIVSIVSTLENAGIRVVLISPPPRNTVDMTPYLTFLQAQYPTQTIDVFTPLKAVAGTGLNATYDSGDGIHPNQAGHDLMAATVSANSLWHVAVYSKVIPTDVLASRLTNTTVTPGYYNGLSTFKVRGDGRVENASTLGVQTNLGAMYYKTGGTIGVSSQVTVNGSAIVANTFYGNSTWAATSQGTNFLSFLTAGNSNLVSRMFNSGGMTIGVGLSADPGTNILQVLGRIGIGSSTVPTARMHITAAGATSAGSSQLKFTSGPLMTTPEVGAFEFLTDGLYFTQTTSATRQQIAFLNSPTFLGTPTLPTGTIAVTQAALDGSTKPATTAYADRAAGNIIGTPTIAAGAGAGTTPTVSVTSNAHGLQVTVTTGTLPTGTNAVVATVTLANALSYTPYPVFSSANANTSLLNGASMIYMTSSGTANVTITSGTTALVASTTYVWNISL